MGGVTLQPMVENNTIILYDIYVDGVWCGSRRTIEQCKVFLSEKKS
jgi:hypothetical protein